jgi:PAS domain S-box-containing protein
MEQPSILIVEDSASTAEFLASFLTEKNFNVIGIADNSEDAVKIVKKTPPDIIFMDTELKGKIDGIESARMINSIAELPIIFLTGNKDLKYIDRIKEVSPYAYLTKPFKSSELFFTIETSLYKHRMIKKVKESEERLNLIWNNLQTAIIIVDEATDTIMSVNPMAAEIFALPSENIIGHNRKEFFLNVSGINITEGSISDDFITKETVLLNGKNEKIPIYKTIQRIKLKEKSNLLISFIDMTEQKKNAIEITNARDEIQSLLSSLVTILIGVSIKDEVTHWNKIAEKTFGIPASNVIGIPVTRCKINWDWPIVYEGIYQSICDNKQVRLTNLNFTNFENKAGFLDITISPIKDKENNFKGFILAGEDITERKDLEMQLAHSQKMESLGKLSAGIAHEINTPTQYITSNVYFLEDSFLKLLKVINHFKEFTDTINGKSSKDELLTKIKDTIKQIDLDYIINEIPKALSQSVEGLSKVTKIVKSMRNFSYPASNSKVDIDINSALEDVVNISQNEWKYYADVIANYDKNLSPVPCYPGELNQVFLNIIINAVDAIKEKNSESQKQKGIIEISTGVENNWAVITIKDTGAGISVDIIDKIFDPFFTTKKIGKGTGQGLAVAYDIIVNKHNGKINFTSGDSSGATCVIKIPTHANINNPET